MGFGACGIVDADDAISVTRTGLFWSRMFRHSMKVENLGLEII